MKPKTIALEKDRKSRLQHTLEDCIKTQPALAILQEKLLKIGGEMLCPLMDPDCDKVLKRGERFTGRVKMMPGARSQCHMNAANLWNANRDKTCWIATGYGLSDDGLWRQHSWVIQELASGRLRIVETTTKRIAYFGFRLTKQEAEEFCYYNAF